MFLRLFFFLSLPFLYFLLHLQSNAPANVHVCVFKSTEPAAGGGVTGPVDQHSAAAGSDPSCSQLGDVYHGCAHVFPDVL